MTIQNDWTLLMEQSPVGVVVARPTNSRFTFALTAFSTWHNASAVARKSLAQRFSAGLVLYLNMSPVGTAQIAVSAVPTALGFCMPNAFCDPEKLAILARRSCDDDDHARHQA